MDEQAVDRALLLDEAAAGEARAAWRELMDLAVFGDLRAASPAALTRLRKRALDAGERVRSMYAGRAWIPRPRERLKNALASLINLRQSVDELERAVAALEGGADLAALRARLNRLSGVVSQLEPAAGRWANLLETLARED